MDATTQPPSPAIRRHFGKELAARQFAIYRAEWQIEAEPSPDPMPAITALVTGQLEFNGIAQHPDLAAALEGTAMDDAEAQELKRLRAHALGIGTEQLQQLVGAALQSLQAWHMARAMNDFSQVEQAFAQLVALLRPIAATRAKNLSALYGRDVSPYEAMVDFYDPGRTLDFIHREFARLVPVCQEILQRENAQALPVLPQEGNYSADRQAELAHDVITAMGYNVASPYGKLAVSAHPFCRRVGPREVWLTNNYEWQPPLAALITIIHEGGHGRYYQGLPADRADDWMGMVSGEAINEGMALLAEHLLARRPAFARFLAPKMSRAFGVEIGADTLHAELTRIERSPIRTMAGEAVYPLHLVLRTEIEEALVNGTLEVKDLPATWNRRSAELLGITPKDDSEGVLQDIQMFAGYIGYFPCYLLGHMAAAQIWPVIEAALPELDDQMAEGDFAALNGWLHDHIYRHGRLLSADRIIEDATGQPFSADALVAHLQDRYKA